MHAPRYIRLLCAAAVLAFALPAAVKAQQMGTKDLSVEQRPVAEIQAPVSDFMVSAWVDRDNATYQAGDTVTLFVKSNKDAHITVIDVGTSGKVHVIFPNKYQKDNRVLAHQVLQIPGTDARFRVRAGGPSGTELIKIVATARPGALIGEDKTSEAGPFRTAKGTAQSIARDLAVELKEEHQPGFATYNQVILITEKGAEAPASPTQAAPQSPGSPEVTYRLGEAAFFGDGGAPDYHEAMRHLRQAADAGHVQAMYRIGWMYEKGVGIGKEIDAALDWYRRAGELGNTQAMVRIARIYGRGIGGKTDYDRALSWLRKASKAGDGIAMLNLAVMYDKGWGVPVNPQEASRHLLRAIRAGAWQVQQDVPEFSYETRQEAQRSLKQAGHYRGAIDGKIGPETRQALAEYARTG